jgi:hypothetical protein
MTGAFVKSYRDNQQALDERLTALRTQTEALLGELEGRPPGTTDAEQLSRLFRERDRVLQEQRELESAFVKQLRELEEANRRAAAMAEKPAPKRASTPRSQEKIEKLSGELSTNLRLDRVDNAIKELMSFLADTDFFAANVPVGRKRRLKALETALQGALG